MFSLFRDFLLLKNLVTNRLKGEPAQTWAMHTSSKAIMSLLLISISKPYLGFVTSSAAYMPY